MGPGSGVFQDSLAGESAGRAVGLKLDRRLSRRCPPRCGPCQESSQLHLAAAGPVGEGRRTEQPGRPTPALPPSTGLLNTPNGGEGGGGGGGEQEGAISSRDKPPPREG